MGRLVLALLLFPAAGLSAQLSGAASVDIGFGMVGWSARSDDERVVSPAFTGAVQLGVRRSGSVVSFYQSVFYFMEKDDDYPWIAGLTGLALRREPDPGRSRISLAAGAAFWGEFVDGFENGEIGPGINLGWSGRRSGVVVGIDVTGGVLFNGRDCVLGAIRLTVGAGS